MAQKKITDLQLRSDLDETCSFPVDDAVQTWRVTGEQLKDFIHDELAPIDALGDIIVGGASGVPQKLSGNTTTTKKVLTQTGTGSVSALPSWTAITAPTITRLTSTGTTAGYMFTVTSANATVGATYTNNGNTFTVLATIAGATTLFCSGASAPQTSGTLTKASGTGDSTITFSAAQAMATYTTPADVSYLRVKMVGGGGGGSGSDASAAIAGVIGKPSAFGTNLLIAGAGAGAPSNSSFGAAGGAPTVNSPALSIVAMTGNCGGTAASNGNISNPSGEVGAGGPWGGAGCGAQGAKAGGNAAANSGAGGGGAGLTGSSTIGTNSGAAGAYIEAQITGPSATYYYTVGTGGAGGTGGSGSAGGNGGSGVIIVEEYYQ